MSVIVPTRRGWPVLGPTLDALRDQAQAHDAEVLILDGSDAPEPAAAPWPGIRWVRVPGASVFQLRVRGYEEAAGEIVAVTEDHCRPFAGWLDAHVRAHAEHPEAAAVCGAVENGTTDHVIDWAAFFLTQSPAMPPLPNGTTPRMLGTASLSFKRRALQRVVLHSRLGALELLDSDAIRGDGDELIADDSAVVLHDQCMGRAPTVAIEFHNGRTIAGFRRRQMGRGDWARAASVSALPLYRSARTARQVLRKGRHRRELLTSLPWLIGLQYAAAAGEFVGYLTGPGTSPNRLR